VKVIRRELQEIREILTVFGIEITIGPPEFLEE
jgi:hypothetical protein